MKQTIQRRIVGILTAFVFSGLVGCGETSEPGASNDVAVEGFSFVVIGDTPYGAEDEVMLASAIAEIKKDPPPFIIHIGDYKGGGAPCTSDHDDGLHDLIGALAPIPVFYTPGDNEWTDCDRFDDPATGKKYSDLDRLALIRSQFFAAPATSSFSYRQQAALIENASWAYDDVRFLTSHVTGTNNGRDWVAGDPQARALSAVEARDQANLEWLEENLTLAIEQKARALVIAMQSDMTDIEDKPNDVMCKSVAPTDEHPCDGFAALRAAIKEAATRFDGQVLLIHGDTAPFTLGKSFSGEEADRLWRLNAAGDAGIGRTGFPYGTRDVTVVTISDGAVPTFAAHGLLTAARPKSK